VTIRVLLADDHALLRRGLRALLEQEPDIEVVAEVGDGRAVVRRSRERGPTPTTKTTARGSPSPREVGPTATPTSSWSGTARAKTL